MIGRARAALAPWVRRIVLVSILAVQIVSLSMPPIHAVGVQVANRTSRGMSALWSLDDDFGTVVGVTGFVGSEQLPPGPQQPTPETLVVFGDQSFCDSARDVFVFRSWFGDAPGSVTVGPRLERARVAGTASLDVFLAEYPGCASPDFDNGSFDSFVAEASAQSDAVATDRMEAGHLELRGFDGKLKMWSGRTQRARHANATGTIVIAALGISFSDLATEEALIFDLRVFDHAIGICLADPEVAWPHCPRPQG